MALCNSYMLLHIYARSVPGPYQSFEFKLRVQTNVANRQCKTTQCCFLSAVCCLVNEIDYYLRIARRLLVFGQCCEHLLSENMACSFCLIIRVCSFSPRNHGISQRRKLKSSSMPGHCEVKDLFYHINRYKITEILRAF